MNQGNARFVRQRIHIRCAGQSYHSGRKTLSIQTTGELQQLPLRPAEAQIFHDKGNRKRYRHAAFSRIMPILASSRLAIVPGSTYTLPMKTSPSPLRVVVSLDVEEEGLFSGSYASRGCSVRNVALLERLAPLSDELGFPLTLFCAHTVLTDTAACRTLEKMRDHHGAEIAAHLHHWSTPPLDAQSGSGTPQRTHTLDRDLLRRRLATLLEAGRVFNGAPLTSFRMGRWDLKNCVRPLLAEQGITLDSSVCPLRQHKGGPDHFLAPADPYWVDGATPDGTPLLEAPIT